ncbi:Phosphoribosyl 1,2-cyclic phosphodiesterase [Terribacillus aidingensis]|uniref:Phosphoribosyl 1,2-cyclic phosphodiesterase n=1 Tax=Terribacillus aidingensis TaxID=586416 RepID=A0A285P006_9BACI|nr:MBL fold metallo-hydrolase [Terribacillus aidingensis]SNZ14523.1 Phosphoribosyl 1,2-cyclic phosphodiesterase [Terribacillus aidingensis]
MKVDILASGSSGNCIALTAGNSTILVDCGIAKTKIEKRLMECGIEPGNILAIFVTHAHNDHIKGLPIAEKYHIPVYAGEEEWKSIKNVPEELQHPVYSESILFDQEGYGDWFEIEPFKTHHDAYDPRGYAVCTENHKVSICLDTGHVDADMLEAMKNSQVYIIESNHDPVMVEHSDYPNSVKARIVSQVGHLSNMQTAEALAQLVQGEGEKIYLTHLSSNNNMPSLALMTTVRQLMKKGFKQDKHYEIEVF